MRFLFQILGAFADPSGVPMQGMKIKNVVPGKNRSFFCPMFLVFGTLDRLRVPRHFALRIKIRIVLPLSPFWLSFVVCGLKSFSKAGWDLFPSSVIMLKTTETITAFLCCWQGDTGVWPTICASNLIELFIRDTKHKWLQWIDKTITKNDVARRPC